MAVEEYLLFALAVVYLLTSNGNSSDERPNGRRPGGKRTMPHLFYFIYRRLARTLGRTAINP